MKRRTLLAGAAALAAAPARARPGRTRIVFWHAMSAALGEEVNHVCANFNAAQVEVEVEPVYKGTYPETMTAVIAAARAGQAPHLVQVFEVGTGTMLAAGPAAKQVWALSAETGVALDPARYIGGVRGYYSLADGRLAAMPFNASTALMWYNKDAFEKAGLDPDHPPATWPETVTAARALKARGTNKVAMTTAWPTWIQLEQYAAMHDLVFATRANGFEGLDAELRINTPPFVKQVQRLLDMAREGTFTYGGRDGSADSLFPSGEAAISFNSSSARAAIAHDARFRWAAAMLPTDPEVNPRPINSVIGGASLWTMTAPGRTAAEYKGCAALLAFLAEPATDAAWHQDTGYVPVTFGGYEMSKAQGYYDRTPGADLPIRQLTRGEVTPNSRGFRLGRMAEIRVIIQEELERALQGQQGAQAALDIAVARGNRVLRDWEKAVKG